MTTQTVLFASSLALLAAGTGAYGTEPAAEPAIARTISDPGLQWGPCPEFIPKGCGLAVLHGEPPKPNVDVFLKVPAGMTLPNHKHTSAERMVLVADRKSTRLNSSHNPASRMPSSA
jgi:hypothetical protein